MIGKEKEYQKIFISESREELNGLNQALVQLEKEPDNIETLTEMLRLSHIIKGNAAAIGYEEINRLAHGVEDVLISIKDRKNTLTSELADSLFRAFDIISDLLTNMKRKTSRPIDVKSILAKLDNLAGQKSEPEETMLSQDNQTGTVELADTLKVPVNKLDDLLNLVGELVIDGSHIVQLLSESTETSTKEMLTHFRRVVTDIQDNVMGLRMVPVATMFSKFARLVRDLSHQEKKDVNLVFEGEETELDRTILEKLSDPVLHLIRNAVDHGMEPPEERSQQGKEPTGQITLTARREQQKIILEVIDDGRGIDIERIKQKAVELGIVTPEIIATWRNEEILNLICQPGFTLAKTTTTVSGRGIGMDVVKQGVDALGGELRIESTLKQGTTIRIEVPPSVAVIKALLFGISSETYALPLLNVRQLRVVENKDIHQISDAFVVALEEETIPLLFLESVLGENGKANKELESEESSEMNLLIAESGDRQIGLMTGELINIQDIVIKPLKEPVNNVDLYSGVTVLGSGELCLILDLAGILRKFPIKQLNIQEIRGLA